MPALSTGISSHFCLLRKYTHRHPHTYTHTHTHTHAPQATTYGLSIKAESPVFSIASPTVSLTFTVIQNDPGIPVGCVRVCTSVKSVHAMIVDTFVRMLLFVPIIIIIAIILFTTITRPP
jgi:hypothetical protein